VTATKRRRWAVFSLLAAGLVVGGAALSWRAIHLRTAPSAMPADSAGEVLLDGPSFRQPAQSQAYYAAVAAGETRALATVEAALEEARKAGASPSHIRKLETLREQYRARLPGHTRAAGQTKVD
jgi:hypothetical protein